MSIDELTAALEVVEAAALGPGGGPDKGGAPCRICGAAYGEEEHLPTCAFPVLFAFVKRYGEGEVYYRSPTGLVVSRDPDDSEGPDAWTRCRLVREEES